MTNTWPGGERRALTQTQHDEWNADHSPGTRQTCFRCGEFTERCEDDSLYLDDGEPLCEECYDEAKGGDDA